MGHGVGPVPGGYGVRRTKKEEKLKDLTEEEESPREDEVADEDGG